MCDNLEVICRKTVKVDLVGGLGNQLFGYSAGFYLAKKLRFSLICIFTKEYNSIDRDISELQSLELPGTFIQAKEYSLKYGRNFHRVVKKLKRKSLDILGINLSKHHYSQSIGFDSELENLMNPTHLHGYFQSWFYAASAREPILEAMKENVALSKPAQDLAARIKAAPSLVVHIRLGDYKNPENDFIGILSPKYYENALQQLDAKQTNIYVFSDEIIEAKNKYEKSFPKGTYWVDSNQQMNALETLLVMKNGHQFVIANSTFSWWAAFLSDTESKVFAPAKWFKGQKDPSNLYPKHWKVLESLWEK